MNPLLNLTVIGGSQGAFGLFVHGYKQETPMGSRVKKILVPSELPVYSTGKIMFMDSMGVSYFKSYFPDSFREMAFNVNSPLSTKREDRADQRSVVGVSN